MELSLSEICSRSSPDSILKASFKLFKSLNQAEVPATASQTCRSPSQDLAYLWHQCTAERNCSHVHSLHTHLLCHGLEVDSSLGNSLVSFFVNAGGLYDAHWVFNSLNEQSESSRNSLICGYVKVNKPRCALALYDHRERDDTLCPGGTIYVAALKACSQLKSLEKGVEIHAHVAALGLLERDLFVGSTLLDMYANCGCMAKAQQVFDELPDCNVVSWTALIGGYVEHGEGEEALRCFQAMQDQGIHPNRVTFICSLKACAITGDIVKGQEIHAEVERQGCVDKDLVLGSNLVYMYSKFGMFGAAQEAFQRLPTRNIVTWTSMILGYVEHGHCDKAFDSFEEMQVKGVAPNAITFGCILKACSSTRFVFKGTDIHAEIERQGLLEKDVALGNILVDMYFKWGQLAKAQQVFSVIPSPNVVTWTLLISGYAEHGYDEKALDLFDKMQAKGVLPNTLTLICSLKACGSIKAIEKGKLIQVEVERQGLLEGDCLVANALIDMYVQCGLQTIAQQIFDKISVRDVTLWNTLVFGYTEHGHGKEALQLCEQLQLEGVLADVITFASSFKACGIIMAIRKGQEMHAKGTKINFFYEDDIACSSLIDMYAKFGLMTMAKQVFNELPFRSVLSWTSIIAGYVEHGFAEEALSCFEQIQVSVLSPVTLTYIFALKACSIVASLLKGYEIHAEIQKRGLAESNPVVISCLFNMYAKCGSLDSAQQLFDSNLSAQDAVSCSALIEGYLEQELGQEGLHIFKRMQLLSIAPNVITLVSSLKACRCIGAIDKGQEIYSEIERQGLIERQEVVGNTLISLYSKCGLLAIAKQVFDRLPVHDVVSWTTLMTGYAQLGQSENVFEAFILMIGKGIKPNSVSFMVVLNACNRRGLCKESNTYYETMVKDFGIFPCERHDSCLFDLLNRAGQLEKAIMTLQKPSVGVDLVVCRSILGACKNSGMLWLANKAFEHSLSLNSKDSASYVLMSHIYAGAGIEEEVRVVDSIFKAGTNIVKKTSELKQTEV